MPFPVQDRARQREWLRLAPQKQAERKQCHNNAAPTPPMMALGQSPEARWLPLSRAMPTVAPPPSLPAFRVRCSSWRERLQRGPAVRDAVHPSVAGQARGAIERSGQARRAHSERDWPGFAIRGCAFAARRVPFRSRGRRPERRCGVCRAPRRAVGCVRCSGGRRVVWLSPGEPWHREQRRSNSPHRCVVCCS